VTVSDGTSSCPATLSNPSADGQTYVGSCTLDGETGGMTVTATYDTDAGFAPLTSNQLVVQPFSQTVSFSPTTPLHGVVGAGFTPSASATSSLAVNIAVDPVSAAVCNIDPATGTLTFTQAGTCTLDATQPGDDNYLPASADVNIAVYAPPSFTAASPPTKVAYGSPYGYPFAASGSGPITYRLRHAPEWLTINPATGQVSGAVPAGITRFSYQVAAGNRATALSHTPTVTPTFTVTVGWPTAVTGPQHVPAYSSAGFYLSVRNSTWRVMVTQPTSGATTYSGSVRSPWGFAHVQGIRLEPGDTFAVNGDTLTFRFVDHGGIDGVTFTTDATSITCAFDIGSNPAPTSQIYLGAGQAQPTANPLTIQR
jgi:hypothetical protein